MSAGPGRQILHVDMDAFYASVEQRESPELVGRPVVVGGPSRRGVVMAASYEARPFGVRSAMPMADALRRCPAAVVVPPRMHLYAEASASVFEIFRRFTPLVEGLSLDEAFLDVTASRALFGAGEEIARRIKGAIREETRLTASAGVAPSKFVAKIASDLEKPDGLVVVGHGDVEAFLAPLSIERMWGIGPRAALTLREAGFDTIGDLHEPPQSASRGCSGAGGAPCIGSREAWTSARSSRVSARSRSGRRRRSRTTCGTGARSRRGCSRSPDVWRDGWFARASRVEA